MTRRFEGAVVVITGAARGLGRRAAQRFAAEGARLALLDRDEDALAATAAELREGGVAVEALAGDVAREESAAALVERACSTFGRLDVAVNNAGVSHPFRKLVEIEGETVERMLAVNLMGVFYGMKHQIPVMQRQFTEGGRGAAILNVASVAGLVGAPLLSAYAAAKHGIVGLTRSAAAETAQSGVRINALCPAFTDTAMVAGFVENMRGGADEARARLVSAIPMRRLAEVDEIVGAMLSICDPENGFMTGQAIAIDGGLSAV